MRQLTFKNASEAFDFYYGTIPYQGVDFAGTKAMFNQYNKYPDLVKEIKTRKLKI